MSQAVLTVDLEAICANWRALAARAAPAEAAAVVKADAYGLGVARVAPALRDAGARSFFVAQTQEALALREILGAGPAIYCLNGVATAAEAARLKAAQARPVLNTPRQIALAQEAAPPCALMLDSGMNRLGLSARELAETDLSGLDLRLVCTHLACADAPESPANAAQRARFLEMTADPKLAGTPRSLSATGGALLGPDFACDLTRLGIGLYGGAPFAAARPVVRLEVPVIQTRRLRPGDAVGYGATWRAEQDCEIALIAAGYADGLIRALSNRGRGWWRGRAMAFVGRVSMDMIALRSFAGGPQEGDLVELLGPHQTIDDLAAAAGTIGYEILTSLGPRYARRYDDASQQEQARN